MRITLSSPLSLGALGTVATALIIGSGVAPASVEVTASPARRTEPAVALRPPATIAVPHVTRALSNRAGWSAPKQAEARPISHASVDEVPGKALSAYQRAAAVITTAQPQCRLSWTLLAAVGQVASDHGQSERHGVVRGPVLNGSHHTRAVADTDGGTLDGNSRWDRAIGPMHLLPATWTVVAVDADGNGKRDPQNVDDSALGAAVLLCGDGDDLGTTAGRRAVLRRQTGSTAYADLLLALSAAYAKSWDTIPVLSSTASPTDGPSSSPSPTKPGHKPSGSPSSGPTATGPPAGAIAYCTAAGFTDDPQRTDDDFDNCVAGWQPSMGTSPPAPSPDPGSGSGGP